MWTGRVWLGTGVAGSVGKRHLSAWSLAVLETHDRTRRWTAAILVLTCLAAVVAVVPPEPAYSATAASPITDYVMMGDSYSSGAGLANYYSGEADEVCERSQEAFPSLIKDRLLAAELIDEWYFTACLGEEIPHLNEGSKNYPSAVQMDVLNERVKHVTITIGGNDVGFDNMLHACAQGVWGKHPWYPFGSATLCEQGKETAFHYIGGPRLADSTMGTQLVRTYREILGRAPHARLTVLTYPTLFPASYTGRQHLNDKYCEVGKVGHRYIGFHDRDVGDFHEIQQLLNGQVTAAVNQIRDQGLSGRISLVRLDEGEIAEHTITCGDGGKEPYINGLRWRGPRIATSSFHPNQTGHAAYADLAYSTTSVPPEPLSLTVNGPASLTAGHEAEFRLIASSGNPRWEPSASDVNAVTTYTYGFSDVSPGLVVSGSVPHLQVTAAEAGDYQFTASVTDSRGDRVERIVTVSVDEQRGGKTTRVSLATDGTQGTQASQYPSVSGDGRYITFQSSASNLVRDDTNNTSDVFVFDRQTSTTSRVSVSSEGVQINNGGQLGTGVYAESPSISADGRYVAFLSTATDLVPDDTNRGADVFVHDRESGTTSRVSVSPTGAQFDRGVRYSSLSADGRYVAFDTGGDIFVHDRSSGITTLAGVLSEDGQANGSVEMPSISGDGRYIAFQSTASNLVTDDNNGREDVFVHDREAGTTTRVSASSDGAQGNQYSRYPAISADGRYIAFESAASNLVADDANDNIDIFVHDRYTGTTSRVSVSSDGLEGNSHSYQPPSLSDDGRYIAFQSMASNLVLDDANHQADVFVHDRQTRTTGRVSVSSDGADGDEWSLWPSLSGDGRHVAFTSWASNLVSGDTNDVQDVFVHKRW